MEILPEKISQWRPGAPALRQLLRRVKKLPWEGGRAWVAFPRPDAETRSPDLLVLDGRHRAFLLSAAEIRGPEVAEFLQPALFELPEPVHRRRERFAAQARALSTFPAPAPVSRVLFCFGLAECDARALREHLQLPTNVVLSGQPESMAGFLDSLNPAPLERHESRALRADFCVESRIPELFVPRIASPRATEDGLGETRLAANTSYLLDFSQESWVKHDLLLGGEAAAAAGEARTRLITGVAGSGKSLALLYRARLQAALAGNPRFLFVTHNKPLIGDLKWRHDHLASLSGLAPDTRGSAIEFVHFLRWCGKIHFQENLKRIPDQDRITRIVDMARDVFDGSGLPPAFFVDEVAFIGDLVDDSLEGYLEADRTGRRIALNRELRRKAHQVYVRYRGALAANRETDWCFIVRMVWEKIRAGQLRLPRYDVIFVDEGQFFAPVWFAILKACLHPERGEMVMAADPTQGFLKRRLSWKSVGLSVTGRSARLERCYRSRPSIQAFAHRFFQSRIPVSEHVLEETILPGSLANLPAYEAGGPRLVRHRAPQDAFAWAASEISAALKTGLPPQAVLVLVEDHRDVETLRSAIADRVGIAKARVLSHDDPVRDAVAISSLNAATGIERPVVILLGLDSVFEREGDPRLDPLQKEEMIRDHTRKVYMALTRAGEKLLIGFRREETRAILEGESSMASPPAAQA